MNKKYLLVLIAGVLCGAWYLSGQKPEQPAVAEVAEIHTITAKVKEIPYLYRTIGRAEALQEVLVKPQISGRLTDILFKEGDTVREGDIIAVIDEASAEAELDIAEAELTVNLSKLHEAEINFKRYKKLHNSAVVSQKVLEEKQALYEQLQAAVKSSRGQLEIAQINYQHTKITAPISGVIGFRNINRGNLVTTGSVIVKIVQVSPMSVVFSVPQQYAPFLKKNQTVDVFDGVTGAKLGTGTVSARDNAVNQTNGTLRVRAILANESQTLIAGQPVAVALQYGENKDYPVLPDKTVRPAENGRFVFKITGNKAVVVPVVTGYQGEGETVVLKGVSVGEIIAADGFERLAPGTRVRLISEEK